MTGATYLVIIISRRQIVASLVPLAFEFAEDLDDQNSAGGIVAKSAENVADAIEQCGPYCRVDIAAFCGGVVVDAGFANIAPVGTHSGRKPHVGILGRSPVVSDSDDTLSDR